MSSGDGNAKGALPLCTSETQPLHLRLYSLFYLSSQLALWMKNEEHERVYEVWRPGWKSHLCLLGLFTEIKP